MNATRIDKAELLKIVSENRSKHRAIFLEAVEGYRQQAVDLLEKHIAAIRAGKLQVIYVSLTRPEDHTRDYDRVIKMLNMSQDDAVTLSEVDFASYVQDDWQWKRQFLTSNSLYSKTAADMIAATEESA